MLKSMVGRGLPRKTFTEMLFLFACRADDLLYDFTIQSYWEAARRVGTHLTNADALAFFADALARRYIPRPWSDRVEIKIARGLIGMPHRGPRLMAAGAAHLSGSRPQISRAAAHQQNKYRLCRTNAR